MEEEGTMISKKKKGNKKTKLDNSVSAPQAVAINGDPEGGESDAMHDTESNLGVVAKLSDKTGNVKSDPGSRRS